MNSLEVTQAEQRAMAEVQEVMAFYKHLISYCLVIPFLWIINWITSSEYLWAIWPTLGWGLCLSIHGVTALGLFKLFSPEWEKRQIEKRLNR
jgi:hypothetical protein